MLSTFPQPATIARRLLLPGLLAALLMCTVAPATEAQQLPGADAVTPDSLVQRLGLPEGHAPRGALRRALAVPGWGQYYNRQYWKVPVAVAGLGGVLFGLIYSWDRYFLYRNAWRYQRVNGEFLTPEQYQERFGEDGPQYFDGSGYEAAYNGVFTERGLGNNDQRVRDLRDRFRRYGELAILGVGVFWILQVADAYISAHLLGFEVRGPGGEDASASNLSLRVAPDARGGLNARLRVAF